VGSISIHRWLIRFEVGSISSYSRLVFYGVGSISSHRWLVLFEVGSISSHRWLFSSPDPKGQVSYCHHLASVVVVRRKIFQKSSLLKVLDQWKPNLVWIITRVSSFKIVSGDAVHQPTWPLLLKIEHMVKLHVFGNNSNTVNNIKNLTWSKNDQYIKIYLPCNFEVNLITHLGVIALFSSNL
jgi:hypothetical protein